MNREEQIKQAIKTSRYQIEYVKPDRLIQKRSDDPNGNGKIQYFFSDVDTEDYGSIKVELYDCDLVLSFSWFSGLWMVDGSQIANEDVPAELIKDVDPLAVRLSVCSADVELWRIAIGRMEGSELTEEDRIDFASECVGAENELLPYALPF